MVTYGRKDMEPLILVSVNRKNLKL